MVSIEYVHKLLELYNQLCSPLCQQTGISQTSLDILMFLKNNPQYKNAADIVKFRGIKANLVSVHVERLPHSYRRIRYQDQHPYRQKM